MITRAVVIPAATASFITTTGFGDPIIFANHGTDILYLGTDATVAVANGFPVAWLAGTGVGYRIDLKDYVGPIWGYSTAGCDIRLIEEVSG